MAVLSTSCVSCGLRFLLEEGASVGLSTQFASVFLHPSVQYCERAVKHGTRPRINIMLNKVSSQRVKESSAQMSTSEDESGGLAARVKSIQAVAATKAEFENIDDRCRKAVDCVGSETKQFETKAQQTHDMRTSHEETR